MCQGEKLTVCMSDKVSPAPDIIAAVYSRRHRSRVILIGGGRLQSRSDLSQPPAPGRLETPGLG